MTSQVPVQFEFEGYTLRALSGADSPEAFQSWASDPDMMRPMNLPARTLDAGQVAEYWAGFNNIDRFFLGVFENTTGRHVGFWMVEMNLLHRTATIYLAIDKGRQDQDVAFLSGVAVKDWLFDTMGMEKLIGLTLSVNDKVIHMFERGGWRHEAVLPQEIRSLNGEGRLDQVRFGLLAEQWRAFRPGVMERWRNRRKRGPGATNV